MKQEKVVQFYESDSHVTISGSVLMQPTEQGMEFMQVAEILRITSIGDKVYIMIKDNREVVVPRKLKYYETLLEPYGFLRTHRDVIINFSHIRSILENEVTLSDGSTVKLSLRRRQMLMQKIKSF